MKILIENIINPVFGLGPNGVPDRNAVCGQLLPSRFNVRMERRLNGWEVWLRIVVEGVCVHDSGVTHEDQCAFENLAGIARENQCEREEAHRDEVRKTVQINLFGV